MRLMTLKQNQSAALDACPAFSAECDLLVAGLGTAGTELAIMAAQKGLTVIAVEKGNAPCGQGGIGGVWDYYFGTPGGAWEARDRIEEARAAEGYAHRGVVRTLVSDEALSDAGADARYETVVLGVWMSGNRIEGLRVACHGAVSDVRARITADCTGSALLVRMVGGGCTAGRAWDGAQMAYSKVITHAEPNAPIQSRYSFCGRMNGFPDEEKLTHMALSAATLAPCLWTEKSGRVFMEAPMLALREEGNIVAEEEATFEDALRGRRTERPIFYSFTTQDLSNVDRDYAFEDDALQNWMAVCTLDRYGYSVAVPFGAMIPKGYDALLAVGKHFGVDHDLAGGMRMKRDLKKMAEAAADACALAIQQDISVRDVDYNELAAQLRATGCLDVRVDQGIGDLRIDPDCPNAHVDLPDTAEAFRAALDRDMPFYGWSMPGTIAKREENSPALALLSAWLMKDAPHAEIADALAGWIAEDAPHSENYALALGLMGDKRACLRLRRMIEQPAQLAKIVPLPVRAACLLGRIGGAADAKTLLRLVEDNAEACSAAMPDCEKYPTQSARAYAMLSMAVMALGRIAARHPELRDGMARRLHAWAERPFVCMAGYHSADCAPVLREAVRRLFPS